MTTGQEQGNTQTIYDIKVLGVLDPSWEEWFEGMMISVTRTEGKLVTTLTGPIADQAALRGILTRLWDLNLVLDSVIRVERSDPEGGKSDAAHDPTLC